MKESDDHSISQLRTLREASGLSLREFARQIDEQPSNVSFWERTGKLPKPEVLIPMAEVLGVSVEEILGEEKPRRAMSPGSRLGKAFEVAAKLPRRQQQKIAEVVEGLVLVHEANQEAS